MTQQALPKFAQTKRPISLAPAKTADASAASSLFGVRQGLKTSVSSERSAAALSVAQKLTGQTAEVAKAEVSKPVSSLPKKKRKWSLKEILWLRKAKRPSPEQPLAQAEWALEKVTVVRNDLSDSDLEIVDRQQAQAASNGETFLESKKQIAGAAWTRIAAHFSKPSPFAEAPKNEEAVAFAKRDAEVAVKESELLTR